MTDERFSKQVARHLELVKKNRHPRFKTVEDMADALMVSRPTLSRWAAGQNLPHEDLRPSVVRKLCGLA